MDQGGQGLPVDELHGVVVNAALAAQPIDRHNVLVLEACRCLRFVLEALQVLGIERRCER